MSIERHDHQSEFQIHIDRAHYKVEQERMTGAELRRVPTPPVPNDRDLYEVRPGAPDLLIEDGTVVVIRNGMRFFTAPRHINPGAWSRPLQQRRCSCRRTWDTSSGVGLSTTSAGNQA